MTNYSHTPSGTDIFIFGHIGGYSNSKTKMYKFVMKDSNTLVRNYIPALDAYGTPCMFDTVTRTPFYNQGTGEFLYNVKNFNARLPAAYQEVEYLQSSWTQYIDTGYKLGYNSKVEVRFMPPTGASVAIFGGRSDFFEKTFSLFYMGSYNLRMDFRNQQVGPKGYTSRDVLTLGMSRTSVTIDDKLFASLPSTADFVSDFNAALFAVNTAGTISAYGAFKAYHFKIWESDSPVRDYVPCVRTANSVAGMYDLVNAVFYTNQGTGTFTVGPNV